MDTALPSPPASLADDDHDDDHAGGDDAIDDADAGIAGGVAALLGRQLGLDPLWFRIAFVLLTLAGGVGLLVYAALWISLVLAPGRGWSVVQAVGGALLVVGVPVMLVVSGVQPITGWFAVVLLLAGLALALWQPRRAIAPAPVPLDPAPLAGLVSRRAAREERVVVPGRARPRREPSLLGRASVGLAIVVAAVGALVDDGNGGRFHPEQWLGAAALVCGCGLLVGTVVGRARWLVVPAVAFAAAGFMSGEFARLGIPLDDDPFRDRYVYLAADGSASQSVRTGIGDVYVQIDSPRTLSGEVVIDARTALGTVYVQVDTTEVEVEVRGRTDHGRTELDGSAVDDAVILNDGAGGDGRVVVDARVGTGDVVIYRAYSGDAPLAAPFGTVPPIPTVPAAPFDSDLIAVDPYVSATADGWIVLVNAEVVIDPDDRVVVGQPIPLDEWIGQPSEGSADAFVLSTSVGEYRLLPRSLLLTPDGRVVDLQAIRASVAPAGPLPTVPSLAPPTTNGGQP